MGWKGTMRSIAAASKAANKEAERRHKANLKQQRIEDAASAVVEWEDYIANLISVHVDLADAINWKAMASKQAPTKPTHSSTNQDKAQNSLDKFTPKFFDFLSGGSEKKKAKLVKKLQRSIEIDEANFKKSQRKFDKELKEWKQDTNLAKKLIDGDINAIKEVIQEMQTLMDQELIGSNISFQITESFIHAIPKVHGDDIVPNFRRKQLASGNLSETKMPKGDFNELYQDYVASVALKVAGDMFHILPNTEIYVTCVTSMLNSKTGHQEITPILSVQFVKETFKMLNLKNIDPSDSLENFNHNMNFKRTKGLQPVEALQKLS